VGRGISKSIGILSYAFSHSVLFPANEMQMTKYVCMCVLAHDIDYESNHKRMLEDLKYVRIAENNIFKQQKGRSIKDFQDIKTEQHSTSSCVHVFAQ
jgi:hypothetical protein